MSSQELTKKGWLYNNIDQTWYTTREKSPKRGKDSKPYSNGKDEDSELQSYKFDIDQWNLVELNSSMNSK